MNKYKSMNISIYLIPIIGIINSILYQNDNHNILIISGIVVIIFNLYIIFKTNIIKNIHLIVILGILTGFINTIINGSGYGSILIYSNLMLLLIFFTIYHVNEKQEKIFINLVIGSLLIILFIFSEQNIINTYYYSKYPNLTVERLNPNTIGMLYFYLYVFLSRQIQSLKYKKRMKIFIEVGIFCIIFSLVFNTNARASLVAILFYFVLNFFDILRNFDVRTMKKFYCIGLFFTLIFTVIYIVIYNSSDGYITFWNKNLFTGRERVWVEAYEILTDNWLFGYSNKYVFMGNRFTSAHNSLLAEWFVLGIIPMICCIRCIVNAFYNVAKSRKTRSILYALFACLILMTFETILSDSNLYYYFAMLFIVSDEEKSYDT